MLYGCNNPPQRYTVFFYFSKFRALFKKTASDDSSKKVDDSSKKLTILQNSALKISSTFEKLTKIFVNKKHWCHAVLPPLISPVEGFLGSPALECE